VLEIAGTRPKWRSESERVIEAYRALYFVVGAHEGAVFDVSTKGACFEQSNSGEGLGDGPLHQDPDADL
jgi:hypothetical protein